MQAGPVDLARLAGRLPQKSKSSPWKLKLEYVISPQKENQRKLVTSTPSPFLFSSSTNPQATALRQKVLEGTSDEIWVVDIDVRLIGYKNQSVYAVSGTSRCLFSDKYKTT
jgi:hypothetical protein